MFYVVVGLIGVAVGASLIGLLASALGQRISALNEGRSRVLERGHTLILGWSPRLPTIVEELLIANANRTRPVIVILAPRPTTEMEREIRDEAGDLKNTRIVCRSGNPGKPADLELANIGSARSVIILAHEEGDAAAVKAVLAVKSLNPNFSRTRVVAELTNPENAECVRSLSEGRVNTVNSNEVIAQLTAQACYQTGLSTVFRELLSFEGNECYFVDVPGLVGHTYAEALLAFNTSSPIGWCRADGTVQLNPPPGTVFGPGDRVIAVSRDDDTVTFSGFSDVAAKAPAVGASTGADPVKLLIVGWSEFGPRVLDELDEFLAPGSQIEVCVDADLVNPDELRQARPELAVSVVSGGPEDLRSLSGREFDRVIVLGYTKGLSPSQADSRTLLTLLTLRKIWPMGGVPRVRVIAQLLDQKNVALAATTGVDDFIVSDALTSLVMAQLSERSELQAVFDELFAKSGQVLQLQDARRFAPDGPVSFAHLVAAGIAQNVSVFGWRLEATGEVVLNPAKDRTVHFGPDDGVVLIGAPAT